MHLKLLEVFAKLDEYVAKFGANFVIALSGGGDSMALLAIVYEWQNERRKIGLNVKVKACVIDHGIAANSAKVAQTAKERAMKIGIDTHIIRLDSEIETKIQEKARQLRYAKLGQYAQNLGANLILLAHNKDDQIETILFRMARSTGLDGLAGMRELQSAAFANNVTLARPLLHVTRQELRDYLTKRKLEYFNDPANQNMNFSRVKVRQSVSKLKSQGYDFEKVVSIGHAAKNLREALDSRLGEYLKRNLSVSGNKILLKNYCECHLPTIILNRALASIIQSLSKTIYSPSSDKLDNLAVKIRAKDFNGATLSGIKISKIKADLEFIIAKQRHGQKPIAEFRPKEFQDRINGSLWHTGFEMRI